MTTNDSFFTRFELLSENAELPVRSLLPESIRTEVIATGLGEHIDGYYAEDHSLRVRTTEYPIETSARLTDHADREPYIVKLKGWVSDLRPEPHTDQGTPLHRRAAVAWEAIERVAKSIELVTLITNWKVYRNMLIVGAKAPRDEHTGEALLFDLELKEVRVAEVELVEIGTERPSNGPAADLLGQTDLGRTTTTSVPVTGDFLTTRFIGYTGGSTPGIIGIV